LRVALGIAIFTTAALMILTSLDVNITPVIAGASVIGLAISFGSQALVRDIV
jgi:small-conductance mechanosensitive channel